MLLQPIERLRISMIPPLGSKHPALSVFSEPFRLTFVAIHRSPSSPDPLWAAPSPSYSSIKAIELLLYIPIYSWSAQLTCSAQSLLWFPGADQPVLFIRSDVPVTRYAFIFGTALLLPDRCVYL